MGEVIHYELLDGISTAAARASRTKGIHNPDVLLWEAALDYFDKRMNTRVRLLTYGGDPEEETSLFINDLIREEGIERYLEWRTSVIDKIASIAASSQLEAA